MFEQKKKVIIVTEASTNTYASYLLQLLTLVDDTEDAIIGVKDGSVEASIQTEEQYAQNAQTYSSEQYTIFVGNGKIAQEKRAFMKLSFKQYNMAYGCLGKQACVYVEGVVPRKEYKSFVSYAKGINEEISNIKIKAKDVGHVAAAAGLGAGVELGTSVLGAITILASGVLMPVVAIGGAGVLAAGAVGALKYKKHSKEILDQQYRTLILKYYKDGIREFLGE